MEKDNDIYKFDTQKALSEHFFINRESGFKHAPVERELSFYESVCSGNLETVKALFTPLGGEGFGKLCNDELQNLKYHLVISIAMITRFCINGGMQPEEAYSLSDVYIQQTDKCKNKNEIDTVHYTMTIDFTKRMRQVRSGKIYSKNVIHMLDYISDHLHEKITVQDVAEAVSCTVPYVSRLFTAEIGTPPGEYIMKKKIEAAAGMIQFSDCSSLEVSSYFSFSSQSYFIKQFRKYIGITPKEYKRRYYSVGWFSPDIKK